MSPVLKKSSSQSLFIIPKFPLGEELVPVREAQKNITQYFDKGLVRITKNGKSLGYLISDAILDELMEYIEAGNPAFLSEMDKASQSTKRVSLDQMLKKYNA